MKSLMFLTVLVGTCLTTAAVSGSSVSAPPAPSTFMELDSLLRNLSIPVDLSKLAPRSTKASSQAMLSLMQRIDVGDVCNNLNVLEACVECAAALPPCTIVFLLVADCSGEIPVVIPVPEYIGVIGVACAIFDSILATVTKALSDYGIVACSGS